MNQQRGLTLPELMVSMVLGLLVLSATYIVFSMSSSSVRATGQQNQLQESARIGLRVLQNDLAQAGFFAELTGTDLINGVVVKSSPALAAADDCIGEGYNNGSFPSSNSLYNNFHFRSIWATHRTNSGPQLSCENAAVVGSDILQIKRLDGDEVVIPAAISSSDVYFAMTVNEGAFFNGNIANEAIPTFANSKIYRYIHRVYYVRPNVAGIPSLYMHDLGSSGMNSPRVLVEGVEQIEYEFGIDDDGDSVVDAFLTTTDVSDSVWDEAGLTRIVAVRIHMIVVSVTSDSNYLTDTIIYQMPSEARVVSNDKRRRKKLSTTVMLRNPVFVNQRNGI